MSIIPSLSQKLLNGRAYTAFNEVTNGDSMMAVLSVDVMDNIGRGAMAYRRDGFGNEFFEKNFEVWTASIIWGFGATIVRNWVDKQAKNLDNANPLVKTLFNTFGIKDIKSDTLNPDVFKDGHSQQLTLQKVNDYEAKQLNQLEQALGHNASKLADATNNLKNTTDYWRSFFDESGKLIEKLPGRYSQHIHKEGMKIGLAFALPSMIIGFFVPKIYQSITRRSIQHDKEERYINLSHQFAHQPILAQPPVLGKNLFRHQLKANGLGLNMSQKPEPTLTSDLVKNTFSGQRAVFGGLGGMVDHAIQRVRESPAMNTLLIDGVISGGRVWMARNIFERLETVAQELGLIFFAFFARTKIQHFFENSLDKARATVSKFKLPAVKWINDTAGENIETFKTLLSDFKNEFLGSDNVSKNGFDFEKSHKYKWNKGTENEITNLGKLKEQLIANEKLQHYLLENPKHQNILFELAKANGDIGMQTVSEFVNWTNETATSIDQNKLAQFAKARSTDIEGLKAYLGDKNLSDLSASDRKWIKRANIPVHTTELFDAAQEIDAKSLHQTGQKLAKTINLLESKFGKAIHELSNEQLGELKKVMQKSAGTKFAAWAGSILISTAFVGWIIPRSKQLITYFMTGEDKFPGRFNEGKRQNILSVNHVHEHPVFNTTQQSTSMAAY